MIEFVRMGVTYADAAEPTLRDVTLRIEEGELCVVLGATGTGKSTFLQTINGLVPHFSGGTLHGRVLVDGYDTSRHHPRDLAEIVGVVGQDPLAGFVTDTVEEELAYAMEQLAVAPATMRKRVEETLDLLGIAELRDRALSALSGGQQQRVAIGSVLTAHPRILVLDEPTSALDPTAAEEVIAAIARLVHDLGMTVVIAEHRLERVVQYGDSVIELVGDGTVRHGAPAEILATSAVAPPVIELGRVAGWSPLPLSIRDARRQASTLRDRLAGCSEPGTADGRAAASNSDPQHPMAQHHEAPLLAARGLVVRHGSVVAVRQVDLELRRGEVVVLMGRNGSGKSSLMWALQGARRDGGHVGVDGRDPAALHPGIARSVVGLVPQTSSDLLYLMTVGDECDQADSDAEVPSGRCRDLLTRIVGSLDPGAHPRDLSEGQQLGLVLAVQLTAQPSVLLLDEPTRGLDYRAKDRLGEIIAELSRDGVAVMIATHDVEFAAVVAQRVIVMAGGEIVADGTRAQIMAASPALAPQVSRILAPSPWMTVAEVVAALASGPPLP